MHSADALGADQQPAKLVLPGEHALDRAAWAKLGIARYISFCNTARPRSSPDKKTPDEFYFATLPAIKRTA